MDKKKVAKASARIGAKSIIKSAMFASWVAKTGLTVTHSVLGGAASLTNSLMGGTSLSTRITSYNVCYTKLLRFRRTS